MARASRTSLRVTCHYANRPRCEARNKSGAQCGNHAQRGGLCLYHQPEETLASLRARAAYLRAELDLVSARVAEQEAQIARRDFRVD